jgi:signal peptidase II
MIELLYSGIFFLIVGLDQLSKWWIMAQPVASLYIAPFLSFERAINKGISWSLFDSEVTPWFVYVAIFVVTLLLCYHIIAQYKEGRSVFIEVAILAGAVSNSIDRFMYGGVVDFITLNYNNWYFPSFNGADIAITLGVMCMIVQLIQER